WKIVVLEIIALLFGTLAYGASLPISTGYDYTNYGTYPLGVQDNYWINIASYPQTTSAIAPSYTVSYGPPLANSQWINFHSTNASDSSVNPSNPGYTIYRKCFCLNAGYTNPTLSFVARADDTLQVWLNNQTNTLLSPQFALGPPISSLPSTPAMFRTGKNCIYALVEDVFGGATAFDLSGTVSATTGLSPIPAAGTSQTFACGCNTGPNINPDERGFALGDDDSGVIAALIQYAEERRLTYVHGPRRRR
ncbi:MAG TPA: hypothetical protein VFO89_01055, partial [Thermoanaerobaculia bacterium]|nr:hypothetical protein [Thermoanaerobaculia bacterium]